jgi:hypothetical protein
MRRRIIHQAESLHGRLASSFPDFRSVGVYAPKARCCPPQLDLGDIDRQVPWPDTPNRETILYQADHHTDNSAPGFPNLCLSGEQPTLALKMTRVTLLLSQRAVGQGVERCPHVQVEAAAAASRHRRHAQAFPAGSRLHLWCGYSRVVGRSLRARPASQ